MRRDKAIKYFKLAKYQADLFSKGGVLPPRDNKI
jgi:hypothetical protein